MSTSPVTRCAVRAGSYHDSVVLMQLQRALAALPGVLDAGVVMATPANRAVLAAGGITADVAAGPDDLLVAVKAESEDAAAEALSRVDALLRVRQTAETGEGFRPRSLASALKQLPEARWVLISVPGRYAANVAEDALDHGRNVFLYSDNVPVEREAALKRRAREAGLLVLGPDCGTAVLDGVGLGFANRVRRGPIGLVGASGTGLQAVMSHVHALGFGISQAIGTGGRDLSAEVGGITAEQALDLLGRDPETRVIVLIAKPPAPEVAARLLALARSSGKPVVVHFLGAPLPGRRLGNLHFSASLSEAAETAVRLLEEKEETAEPIRGFLRGLFSGGTLAYETLLGLSACLSPLWSNLDGARRLDDPLQSRDHTILDLGADEFTVGRLHPMIDQDLRLRRLRQEAADPEVGLILLDVVLGEGAHADPAGDLAPVIAQARAERQDLKVAAIVIGTDEDPQDLAVQVETLIQAGARVFRTVTEAVEWVALTPPAPLSRPPSPPPRERGEMEGFAAVNIGLESFHESLLRQGAASVQVDWRPPAGGNEKLAALLARMKR
ncbi:MAG TPA: acyl-CoA synthetase FdrA [Thermoanaerobaculia bacterium]|nr:acyl-CoA synthetase FdrA [Thermoanaerobaculia bacterium]